MTMPPKGRPPTVGVFHMSWGGCADPLTPLRTFISSYRLYLAGLDHKLFILFKGYTGSGQLEEARRVLEGTPYTGILVDESEWDIGSYFVGAAQTDVDVAFFCNTYSEILSHHWLLKLVGQLRDRVGLVGCTGSYEAPQHHQLRDNIPFPNPHIRSNSFAINRNLFLSVMPKGSLLTKLSTHLFEHGTSNISRLVVREGLRVLLVGRNGRGYEAAEWPTSGLFRQGDQGNLIVGDNRTRDYLDADILYKKVLHRMAWGDGAHGAVKILPALSAAEAEANDDNVHRFYRLLLGRIATGVEAEAWIRSVEDGEPLQQRIMALVGAHPGVSPQLQRLFTRGPVPS